MDLVVCFLELDWQCEVPSLMKAEKGRYDMMRICRRKILGL